MYRNILLDFLITNNEELLANNCCSLSLVIFNSKLKGLAKLLIDENTVFVYHIKKNYTFNKQYALETLKSTIVEMAFSLKEKTTITYDMLTESFIDPYYLKDLREQTFLAFELIPIFAKDDLVAAVLFYSNNPNPNLQISNEKWLSLVHKLLNDLSQDYYEKCQSLINSHEQLYLIVKNCNHNTFYLNEKCQNDLQIKKEILTVDDEEYAKISQLLASMKKIIADEQEIYYILPNELLLNKAQDEIYLLDCLNHHNLGSQFALIFAKDLDNKNSSIELANKFGKAIDKVLHENIHKVYEIEKGTIAILINQNIGKKDATSLAFELKRQYYLLINVPQDISSKADLIKLCYYLKTKLPKTFNVKDYESDKLKDNCAKLECDRPLATINKLLIKAQDLETIGHIVTPILPDYDNLEIYRIFENATINNLEMALKKDLDRPVFTILSKSLTIRKVYEDLKKIIVKYPLTKLIVHAPRIYAQSQEEVFNNLVKIKELGFIIVVDSSIFMNLEYNLCLKLADAVLIREKEVENSLLSGNFVNQNFFQMLYDNGIVVIMEKIPLEEDQELINELTCLIVDQ